MSRTFRRVKHAYDFYGCKKNWWQQHYFCRIEPDEIIQDSVKYFSDSYRGNSRMINKAIRKMMRKEAKNKFKLEFNKFITSVQLKIK